MVDWKSRLKADPTEWLLEPENPSVRFMTLTRLLDEPESSRKVTAARRAIMRDGAVPRILAAQKDGDWNEPGKFYRDKYRGTVWQLLVLAEHMADGSHPRIRRACNQLLAESQDRESLGFSVDGSEAHGGRHSEVIPCLTGNMVFSLIRLGYLEDTRLEGAVDWIARYQRFDDGVAQPPTGWPYDRYEMCWGTHCCHMGAVKALKALAEVPAERRSPSVRETLKRGCEYLLAHHIYKKSHDLAKVARPGWLHFQFPLMYQSDVLETTRILAELGYRDPRMQDAIELILDKQSDEGRWVLERSFNGRFQVNIERKGNPSKWITMNALRTLKAYYG